ncbi:hypothetical protein BDV09DRAFT_201434 [Aspergillus tetrazonus]
MTNRQRSHVFRVTGLSADQSDENIEASLRNKLNEELTPEERSRIQAKITIVPSCYEPDTRRVALVQFRGGMPQFLSELAANPLENWQMEMGDDEDNDVNFDSHFFGFTQLYAPREKPVVADIIAIAGLDGHAYGSWQGRGNLGRMWLRDFLSKDLPQCRTMIYGYNSKLSSHGVDTILDYGRELMGEIKQVRNTKELQQRPLFFVAHSFGGIILAHCLVKALQAMDDDHPAITSLHRATYGMILFAIPYKGLVIDDIQQMLSKGENKSRQQLLQQISEKSDLLVNQLADFKNLIRDRKVVSFYETGQTRQLDSESQRWRRTGDFILTVNADSALLQLPDHVEDKVPLSADHSMIIKFDTRDAAGYRTALDRLRQFVEDAPRVVAARFVQARHRPPVASTVPFKRDPEFIGREGILDEIKKRHAGLGQRHDRVALVGLAGVGKSQTAIEYSYRVRESAPDIWVFWVHASNRDRFKQGYQQIASVGEIPGRDSPKTNILQLVYQWLCDLRNGHWLMVLDNADDDTMFFDADDSNSQGPLVKFLPQVTHGLILITSRNRLAAENLVGNYSVVIGILPMDEEESLALLRTKIPISQQAIEDEKALVQALEHIPLAIIQAGSYVASRTTRFTVARYLHLFQESESRQTHLLNQEDAKDLRRDPSIRHSVITTWQLSFERIRHSHPIATELLALMSMFDRQGIPEYLVQEDYETLQFEDALARLISYSLIRSEIKDRLFEMHRLVQLSVRVWLDIHNELEQWQEKSRGIMARVLPNGDYENWVQCQELLPHAREVMKPSVQNYADELNWASISVKCGWYLLVRGEFADAEVMHQQALEKRKKVLGPEHPSTLHIVRNLGIVLGQQGKYEDAEAMHRQALEIEKKVLGPEHPSTLHSVNNLGLVLANQGKYKGAEAMHRQALETRKNVLGPEHPETLHSVNNLGSVLGKQGKYEEAEAMYQQALKIKKKVLGPEHPDTLNSINNIGLVLGKQGKYKGAEAMHRQALETCKKVLGPEHPSTLDFLKDLGIVLRRQGKYEEAEAMNQQALEGYRKVLGPEHPDTLNSVNNLGLVLADQGKYKGAEAMHRQALETRKNVLGPEHPSTLDCLKDLGIVLRRQGKYEEAEAMHREALEIKKKMLGFEHRSTLDSAYNLGLVFREQGKYEEAEAMHDKH